MEKFLADDRNIRPLGRTLFLDGTRYLSWCCSGVEFWFTGRSVSAEIWTDWILDEPWKTIFKPYYAVFVNDEKIPRKRFAIESGTNSYEIYSSDTAERVKLRIVKLSEAAFSKTGISSIYADGEIVPTEPSDRKIEFIGDSITCGFGIEGKCAEEGFRTETENPSLNYASLTAKKFGADHDLISWSSIGVYSSWSDDGNINNDWIMPMLYDKTDAGLEGIIGEKACVPWNFEKFPPQVIVLNLGTNDVSYTKDIPERLKGFEQAYGGFVSEIRKRNPYSYIICTLGMMGDELFPSIENSVKALNDDKVFALKLEVQRKEDGTGSENHPNLITHRRAAERLSEFIAGITGWVPVD